MKVNKMKYEDILCYEEFMNKYKYELESYDISQEMLDNMVNMLISNSDWIEQKYIEKIKNIYIAILEIKYYYKDENNLPKLESICKLIKNINCLKLDTDLSDYNVEDFCNKAYLSLREGGDGRYMSKEMEEEFKSTHILDSQYYLDKIKEWNSDNKELIEILNNDAWRFV